MKSGQQGANTVTNRFFLMTVFIIIRLTFLVGLFTLEIGLCILFFFVCLYENVTDDIHKNHKVVLKRSNVTKTKLFCDRKSKKKTHLVTYEVVIFDSVQNPTVCFRAQDLSIQIGLHTSEQRH